MRLYQIIKTGEWFGTQADAKAHARQIGGSFEPVEVPTDKPGLLRFLNVCRVGAITEDEAEQLVTVEQVRASYPANTVAQIRDFTADEIKDFILNRASVAQVGNIFEYLGTRFAELVRQRRAA